MSEEYSEQPVRVERCDVCIVGAGIAGLNALFVASRYLSRDQRVVLVDRRDRVGGMWIDTYPYVRLHQPHSLFTAGNIAWTIGREPSYLATKTEVLDHFEHCLDVIRRRVTVDEYFGWTMESDEETDGIVRVSCRSANGDALHIRADRLIKASGFCIEPNAALATSSTRVRSVSPDESPRGQGVWASDAPVWIIGGGKTAMDTVHTLVTERPGREVNLVAGMGTYFVNRDRYFPTGARRWWGTPMTSTVAAQVSRRFDGTNEAEVANWFRARYATSPTPEAGNFFLGVLSEAENATIVGGLHDVVMDRFVDAVDRGGATDLVFRSGARRTVEPGSWIINCTGYVLRQENPYEPYTSASGAVISIQPRSATFHLSSFMGYFTTHLMFAGEITAVPLYELDMYALRSKSVAAGPYTLITLAQYNAGLVADAVPSDVFRDFGLDFDRWYPLPRRLAGAARFAFTHRRSREQQRRTLDTVRERFGVRCGPLV
ncbi:FAD-dependent oxidoreductase [Rhodococcus sp. NPDC003318]|uniref:FAD-dependent oxidoreductase n=1 Tax=Rhodococcus sp. NPDC003318 TaxID=3364503 RepID=UPI00369ED935